MESGNGRTVLSWQLAREPPQNLFSAGEPQRSTLGNGECKNVSFDGKAAYLNGKYIGWSEGGGGYELTTKMLPPSLLNDFTVSLSFKEAEEGEPDSADYYRNWIIVGGPSYRWFSLAVTNSGVVTCQLDNQRQGWSSRLDVPRGVRGLGNVLRRLNIYSSVEIEGAEGWD